MSEQEQDQNVEPEEREETVEDLDVPDEQSADVSGGSDPKRGID